MSGAVKDSGDDAATFHELIERQGEAWLANMLCHALQVRAETILDNGQNPERADAISALAAEVANVRDDLNEDDEAAERDRLKLDPEWLADVIAKANEPTRSRLPLLHADSSRRMLVEWLQACDPNGCHTDERARREGFEPYTIESAWNAIADMVEAPAHP